MIDVPGFTINIGTGDGLYGSSFSMTVLMNRLQNTFGYNLGDEPTVGVYGPKTKAAVFDFQKKHDLDATGVVNIATWNLIVYGSTVIFTEKSISAVTGIDNRSGVVSGGNVFTNIEISDGQQLEAVSYILKLGQGDGKRSINSEKGPLWMPLPVIPEQVSKSLSANWESLNIPGRAASYYSYTGTSNRTVNFSIQLHNDLLENYTWVENGVKFKSNESSGLTMNKIISFLESCCYPIYESEKIIPPVVLLKIGDEIKMRGIINNVSETSQLPFRDVIVAGRTFKKYLMKTISISFTEVPARNPNAGSIYNYGLDTTSDSLLSVNQLSYGD